MSLTRLRWAVTFDKCKTFAEYTKLHSSGQF